MTTQLEELAPESPAKTTAGNYFVGNYPPFSFWNAEGAEQARAAIDMPPINGTPMGIYVHLPFCRRRCHFCYFRVYTGRDARQDRVTQYIDAVLHEAALYSETRLLAGRKPRYVYFGGGTPSFLSVEQLTQLFKGLQKHFPWDDIEEIAFESEPGTLTDEKLHALRELGVTRLSLGVENFDDEILRSNGRAHLSQEIYRAYEVARAAGFQQINIDLIAGMLNETEPNWKECVRKTIEMAPDCVTVYQLEVPFNTKIYKEMREKGEIVAPVADWPTKRAWVDFAFSELEKAGYTITSGYTAIRNPDKNHFWYREYLWRGADMMALGVASFGYFRGTHYQNEKDFGPYVDRMARGELPIARGMTLSDDDRLIREFILLMKLGQVDAGYFQEKFGVNVFSRFAEPLRHHAANGYLTLGDNRVTLTRQGLLRVDEALHEFFRPEHRGSTIYLMEMDMPNLRGHVEGPPAEPLRRLTPLSLKHGPASGNGHGEPESCGHFLALLNEFYEEMPDPPAIEAMFVAGESMPQPQQGLLVHLSDMTSTLARHHGEPIALKVLHRHQGPQLYRRHIVLETEVSRRPVEYGAMRILLPLLSEAARMEVLAARAPLGAVLARHGLAYRHCPGGFFKIRSNRLIEQSLGLRGPQWLFGRCNCMSDSVGRVVAEVVEVLPP